MKIERIDDKTVKCFLSNEELEEYDIDYKDFVTRSDKAKEMERAYKNQALKEGAAADAVTFNENSENCYLDPRCEVLWFRPTPFDSLTTSPLPTENLKRDFN